MSHNRYAASYSVKIPPPLNLPLSGPSLLFFNSVIGHKLIIEKFLIENDIRYSCLISLDSRARGILPFFTHVVPGERVRLPRWVLETFPSISTEYLKVTQRTFRRNSTPQTNPGSTSKKSASFKKAQQDIYLGGKHSDEVNAKKLSEILWPFRNYLLKHRQAGLRVKPTRSCLAKIGSKVKFYTDETCRVWDSSEHCVADEFQMMKQMIDSKLKNPDVLEMAVLYKNCKSEREVSELFVVEAESRSALLSSEPIVRRNESLKRSKSFSAPLSPNANFHFTPIRFQDIHFPAVGGNELRQLYPYETSSWAFARQWTVPTPQMPVQVVNVSNQMEASDLPTFMDISPQNSPPNKEVSINPTTSFGFDLNPDLLRSYLCGD
ncbi:hypothetical protein HK098_008311 [Nowakowskiella sp. JEL0407]|nr:hypothetical protein HK098_008311 [Nowakowskiella sp. JEL0407]